MHTLNKNDRPNESKAEIITQIKKKKKKTDKKRREKDKHNILI